MLTHKRHHTPHLIGNQWCVLWIFCKQLMCYLKLHSTFHSVNVRFYCRVRLQWRWISVPFIGVYYTIIPILQTYTRSHIYHRTHPFGHVSQHRHTHQATLIPHIRSHLHIPSSRILIFVELYVGSPWSVGTPDIHKSTSHLINNFHIWGRCQGIPPSPDGSNMPVLQIYTHPSLFKYSLKNTVSLFTIANNME